MDGMVKEAVKLQAVVVLVEVVVLITSQVHLGHLDKEIMVVVDHQVVTLVPAPVVVKAVVVEVEIPTKVVMGVLVHLQEMQTIMVPLELVAVVVQLTKLQYQAVVVLVEVVLVDIMALEMLEVQTLVVAAVVVKVINLELDVQVKMAVMVDLASSW